MNLQITLENASRNSKPVKYLEQKIPSLDATRLCVSFAEAKFGRLFFKPITVPGRIWLSWKGTKMWKQISNSSKISRDFLEQQNDSTKSTSLGGRKSVDGRQRYNSIAAVIIRPKDKSIFLRECKDFSLL